MQGWAGEEQGGQGEAGLPLRPLAGTGGGLVQLYKAPQSPGQSSASLLVRSCSIPESLAASWERSSPRHPSMAPYKCPQPRGDRWAPGHLMQVNLTQLLTWETLVPVVSWVLFWFPNSLKITGTRVYFLCQARHPPCVPGRLPRRPLHRRLGHPAGGARGGAGPNRGTGAAAGGAGGRGGRGGWAQHCRGRRERDRALGGGEDRGRVEVKRIGGEILYSKL